VHNISVENRIKKLLANLKIEHLKEDQTKLKIDVELQKPNLKVEHLKEGKSQLKIHVKLHKSRYESAKCIRRNRD
jgi:hypothetical protein